MGTIAAALVVVALAADHSVAAAHRTPVSPLVLRALQEPDLAQPSTRQRVFRFTWLPVRTTTRLISVRLEWAPGGPQMIAKAFEWHASAFRERPPIEPEWPGSLALNRVRSISERKWATLAASRDRGFWRFHPDPYPRSDLVDGTHWILEGRVGAEYHRISQHSPRESAFRTACMLMLEASGLELNEYEWESFYGDGVEPASGRQ